MVRDEFLPDQSLVSEMSSLEVYSSVQGLPSEHLRSNRKCKLTVYSKVLPFSPPWGLSHKEVISPSSFRTSVYSLPWVPTCPFSGFGTWTDNPFHFLPEGPTTRDVTSPSLPVRICRRKSSVQTEEWDWGLRLERWVCRERHRDENFRL